jgi:hypothetical protein
MLYSIVPGWWIKGALAMRSTCSAGVMPRVVLDDARLGELGLDVGRLSSSFLVISARRDPRYVARRSCTMIGLAAGTFV